MVSEQLGRESSSPDEEGRVIVSSEPSPPTPSPSAAAAEAPAAETGDSAVPQRECARCASQTQVAFPRIPTRDSALRRTVYSWLEARPDLRDAQYIDLLILKGLLRRHYTKLAAQLSKGGLLTKNEGKLKQAVPVFLEMVRAIQAIDKQLPPPPPPPMYRYLARCRSCDCESCSAESWERRGDLPAGEAIDGLTVEEATKMASMLGQEPDLVIRQLVELEAEMGELKHLRSEVAKLQAREAERAKEPEAVTGDVRPPQLGAAESQPLLTVGVLGVDGGASC